MEEENHFYIEVRVIGYVRFGTVRYFIRNPASDPKCIIAPLHTSLLRRHLTEESGGEKKYPFAG